MITLDSERWDEITKIVQGIRDFTIEAEDHIRDLVLDIFDELTYTQSISY